MSYILDALQRADAERARGGVPTLHARPMASTPAQSGLTTAQRTSLAIAVATTLVAAALAWWFWRPVAQQAAQAQVTAAVPAYTASTALLVPLPSPASVPTRAVAAVTVAPPPPPPPATSENPASSASAAPPAAAPAPVPKGKAIAASTPAVADIPSAAPALVPLLSELPEATRRQIPALAISGAVYSENPSQRLLLVNGLVLNQGAQVTPDLTVVEIHSNNSEFNYKGTRFRVAH